MTFIMFLVWQTQGDQYYGAFTTCGEAYYQGSEAKRYVEVATDKLREEYPVAASAAPVAYAVGVRREFKIQSSKVTIIPDTVTTYHYNHNTRSGSIGINWRF